MQNQGYIPTGPKRRSVIDGRDVVFLYHIDNCLIELLDGKNKSDEGGLQGYTYSYTADR